MANANPSRPRNVKPPVEKPTAEQLGEAKELKLQEGFVKIADAGNNGAMLTRFTGQLPQGN